MKKPLYIISGSRTPFCKMGTNLANTSAVELARTAVAHLLSSIEVDRNQLSETIFGCVGQPADAANFARVVALRSGIPQAIPAVTVHRNCASGMEAITHAMEKASADQGDLFVVGGAESMSQYPLLFRSQAQAKFMKLQRSRTTLQKLATIASFRPKDFAPQASLELGLTDPVCGLNMGQTAENLAREFGISREAQDQFALNSHQLACAAREKLAEEIAPVYPPDQTQSFVDGDNGPREKQSNEALAKLKPVFDREGSVTAGNASQITDGAVALLVGTEEACQKYNLTPMARVTDYAYAGCDPARMGLGPVYALARLMQSSGWKLSDADLFEINEAFAAQVIACLHAMESDEFCQQHLNRPALGKIDPAKLNVNGGAVALGHPVGATGARLVLTAANEMRRRAASRALISLCVGGGQGGALSLENI